MRHGIYVAASWRTPRQIEVVAALRAAGHDVYDFRHPAPGIEGFNWRDVAADPKGRTPAEFCNALAHPISRRGFAMNWRAMHKADIGVLVCPSGRSSHLEAGYFVGAGKPLFVLLDVPPDWELMYSMATQLCASLQELRDALEAWRWPG